jgi:hypothetical protein
LAQDLNGHLCSDLSSLRILSFSNITRKTCAKVLSSVLAGDWSQGPTSRSRPQYLYRRVEGLTL